MYFQIYGNTNKKGYKGFHRYNLFLSKQKGCVINNAHFQLLLSNVDKNIIKIISSVKYCGYRVNRFLWKHPYYLIVYFN